MILSFARSHRFEPGSNVAGAPAPPLALFLLDDPPARVETRGEVPPARIAELVGEEDGAGTLVVVGAGGTAPDKGAALVLSGAAHPRGVEAWNLRPGSDAEEEAPAGRSSVTLPAPPPADSLGGKLRRAIRRAGRRFGFRDVGRAKDDPTGVPLAPRRGPGAEEGDVLLLPPGRDPRRLPAWVRRIAREHGVDLDDAAYAVVPSRGYRSQKILFVTGPAPGHPGGLAIKVTQDERFNARLRNEHDALVQLEDLPALPTSARPAAAFVGHFGRRIVVGESRVPGGPFRAVSSGRADCPFATAACARLRDLTTGTASPATGAEVAGAVRELVERYLEIYRPGPTLADRLHSDLERLTDVATVPTVFAHGDPGPWNLLADDDGRVVFLDWENAEPRGLPLGDVFYFARTYGAFAAEREGRRWTPSTFIEQFGDDGPLTPLLRDEVRAHLAALDLPASATGPLWRVSSAILAARESWSLPADRIPMGVAHRCLLEVERARTSSASWAKLLPEA